MTTSNSYLEAKPFIETLFSRHFKDHDGYVEVRMIGETVVPKWLPRGEITEADWVRSAYFTRETPEEY